ncbi:MAG: hypothetical protein WBB89_07665 [Candidatus Acidiferrum sp.]
MALQFNIEELLPKEIEDGSPKEFGSVKLPKILQSAMSDATFIELKPTVS